MRPKLKVLPGHHERPSALAYHVPWVPLVGAAPHDRFRHAGVLRLNPAVWLDEPASLVAPGAVAEPMPAKG